MSNVWTFSPSSMPYLQRCISAAPPPDVNNKWFQKFGKRDLLKSTITIDENSNNMMESIHNDEKNDAATTKHEDFFVKIEHETALPVLYILQECAKNPSLINPMAKKLSLIAVDQIFTFIFSSTDVDRCLISTFITMFLPVYLKLQYSRECNEILLKTNQEYPEIFTRLLEKLINDTDIPTQVLNGYISTLDEELVTSFMKILSSIELKPQGFSNNVALIHTTYKKCIKTEELQKEVQKILIKHSKDSSMDKNFGRLFLTFLQTEKSMGRRENIKKLEECLEVHSSVFKQPCFVLLKQLID